jgi:hypothetical protein
MVIWTEEVSNEGHVYAALDDDLASFTYWLAFEDRPKEPFPDAAEEMAMDGSTDS